MKYTSHIMIDRSLEEVIAFFDNPDHMDKWMEGLKSFEHLSGTPGQVGARSKLIFQMGKRRVEMIETIEKRDLPNEFTGTYEANGVFNRIENHFESLGENKTKYTTVNEFQFKGFMKLIAFLFPKAFKKQSYKYMEDFKRFVETHG